MVDASSPGRAVGSSKSLDQIIDDLRWAAMRIEADASRHAFGAERERLNRKVEGIDAAHRILWLMQQHNTWPQHADILVRAKRKGGGFSR